MKIIIDIPDGSYEEICRARFPLQDGYRLLMWINNGTPLPKGHGRLIDADALKDYIQGAMDEIKSLFKDSKHAELAEEVTRQFCRDIDEEPTIIPADESEIKEWQD